MSSISNSLFYINSNAQNASHVHPASYPMGTRALSLWLKLPGCEADHSPTSSAEVKECVELYLHSPLLALCSNPQPGGPGLHIYIPWRLGGPVIPPGTGYPF
jgi:hypothetical protein